MAKKTTRDSVAGLPVDDFLTLMFILSAAASLFALLIVYLCADAAQTTRLRADVVRAVQDTYGAKVIDPQKFRPAAHHESDHLLVRLPTGATYCNLIEGERATDVVLLCGPHSEEPTLRATDPS